MVLPSTDKSAASRCRENKQCKRVLLHFYQSFHVSSALLILLPLAPCFWGRAGIAWCKRVKPLCQNAFYVFLPEPLCADVQASTILSAGCLYYIYWCWLSYARAFPLRVRAIGDGSKATLRHTLLKRRQAVVSLMSLCCTNRKSPYGQLKACSMIKHFPQAHCDGI